MAIQFNFVLQDDEAEVLVSVFNDEATRAIEHARLPAIRDVTRLQCDVTDSQSDVRCQREIDHASNQHNFTVMNQEEINWLLDYATYITELKDKILAGQTRR